MNELEQLKRRVEELEGFVKSLRSANAIPLDVQRAFIGRGFINGVLGAGLLYSTGSSVEVLGGTGVVKLVSSVPSAVLGDSKGVYVATISGGAVNNFMQVSDGIVTDI